MTRIYAVLASVTLLFGGLMATVASPATAAPAATAAAPSGPFQIGTFNMAGGHEDHGDKRTEPVEALVRSVEDRNPAFMTLQETCRDWTEDLTESLSPDYTVAFDPVAGSDGETARCGEDDWSDFGNGILIRNDLGLLPSPESHDLESSAEFEQREMLCARSAPGPDSLVVCSAHLTAQDDDAHTESREHEADVAKGILADYRSRGYTVFVGGDLNATPASEALDRFYEDGYGLGAGGDFKEVDSPCGNDIAEWEVQWTPFPEVVFCRGGEGTQESCVWEICVSKKIDYLFVEPDVDVDWGDATDAENSDHRLLWAEVTV